MSRRAREHFPKNTTGSGRHLARSTASRVRCDARATTSSSMSVVLGVVRDVARALQIRGKGRGAGFGFAKELTTTPRPRCQPSAGRLRVDGRLRRQNGRGRPLLRIPRQRRQHRFKNTGGRTHRHTTHETPWPCEDAMEMRRRRPLRYNGNYEPQHATGATLNAGQAPSLEGAGASVE